MELARLYPAWVTGVVLSPQAGVSTAAPLEVLTTLRGSLLHGGWLSDLWGTDYPGQTRRVQLSWLIWSYPRGVRTLLFTSLKTPRIPSGVYLFPSAVWFEREVWEMLGVTFEGHPDLRRLLTDYGFNGYPLRKDFPVGGHLEVRFSERNKRVVSRGVNFTQEFRTFDFTSPWEN
jgi:NADH-quinone oxidoreductase subunit C